MKQYLVSALLTLSFIPSTALCQSGPSCPSGIHADGYVDFTQLPAPPQPVAGKVQGPFTYTLPVSGVAGLTVQVTIPAGPAGQQAYNKVGYNGEISEVLVYNRVLSVNEAAGVEAYLRNKFGTR